MEGRRHALHVGRVAALAILCGILCLSSAEPVIAHDRLRIVATTNDLKSLAELVGGDKVDVVSVVPANVDAEDYQPTPRDLSRLNQAKLVLRVGADYDLWMDRLIAQAKRPELARGGSGYVDCSFAIALLDARSTQVGPAGGHAHGSGNPHYWLDPRNAEIITGTIFEALLRHDPDNAKYYERRRLAFLNRLEQKITEWESKLATVPMKPMIAYHNNWAYFARRFRLNFAGHIEVKPGIPPSPSHLARLLGVMRSLDIKIIVRQPHEPTKDADFLAGKTGAKIVLLAASVGAVKQAEDYLALFDYNVATLLAAHQS